MRNAKNGLIMLLLLFYEIYSKQQGCRGKQQTRSKAHAYHTKRNHVGKNGKAVVTLCKGDNRIYCMYQKEKAVYKQRNDKRGRGEKIQKPLNGFIAVEQTQNAHHRKACGNKHRRHDTRK